MPSNVSAAFFDLDRTVIDLNSGLAYARFEHRSGRITTRQFAEAILWTLLYHLSVLDLNKTYAKAVAVYAGESSQVLRERTRGWFHDEIAHRRRPGAAAAMAEHRSVGEPLVLLTNSSCYLSEIAAEHWGFDAWIANHFPLDDDGRLQGTLDLPLCHGEGKVLRARRWAEDHGVELGESTFYTDSLSDLPMLEQVAHPRVVCPDPRLRREAKRRGWPVLDWR